MSIASSRKSKEVTASAASAAARSLGRGGSALGANAAGRTLGGGRDSAAAGAFARPIVRRLDAAAETIAATVGKGSATAASSIDGSGGGGFPGASLSIGGFPFPSSPTPAAWWDAAGSESWDKDPHPSGGFLSYFGNQPHNFHLVGASAHSSPVNIALSNNIEGSSPTEVEILSEQQPELVDSDNENARTEKRIMWTEEEDVRLMSSWIENSTDSSCGADRGGNQYWGDVVESYNKTTPSHRKRNLKQCKDRWHKINRWTDLFECAYVKARRVFTSGYLDQMWIDAAHKFYVADNKEAKVGPFVLMEVWKTCREVAKWKTYNEELRNARKRKAFHLEGEGEEKDQSFEEMPKRPIGQKAAKKAALAAKGKSKRSSSDDDGNSKESAIDLDKLDRFSKLQEETNANRIKVLELQQKLSFEKLEATKLAHLTAQETKEGKKLDLEGKRLEKETKMMEAYNNLISQDTSSMSDEEKAERVAAMKCLRKRLFPEST